MKTITTTVLLLICGLCLAQSPTKTKVIGSWKVKAVNFYGKDVPIGDNVALSACLRKMMSKEMAASEGDTAALNMATDMAMEAMRSMKVDFRKNDSVYMTTSMTLMGETQTKTDTLHYTFRNKDLLIIPATGEEDKTIYEMPDDKTLIFITHSSEMDEKLILTRR